MGLTVSPVQYDHATGQAAGDPALQFLLRDWSDNRLPSASADAVLSIECLAHVSDKHRFFAEIERVLKPGRKAVVTAWLACERPTRWQARQLLEPICREGRLAGMGSASEYRELIEESQLELLELELLGSRVRRTWTICGYRALSGLITKAAYRNFLFRRASENWVFFLTLWRIMIAYRLGAMDYGLFVVRKPPTV